VITIAAVQKVSVVVASGQNVFFDELLTALEGALRTRGIETERAVDHFPPLRDDTVYLFVPHEYLPLTRPDVHPSTGQLKRSVALCTEQPGTHWFEQTASVAKRTGAVVDINAQGAAELTRRGVATRVLRLGWTPEWDRWGGDDSQERPVDVVFLGSYTDRRGAALAACGAALSSRRCYLNISDAIAPHTASSKTFLAGERKWERLASSKVLLNIHRAPLAYLEWQRVVEAISNGCVVLTEHSIGAAPLVPGEHFVSASSENFPDVLPALLEDPDLIASIRRSAYSFLKEELPLSESITTLVDALEQAASTPVGDLPKGPLNPRPRPRPIDPPVTEYERLSSDQSEADIMRMALKQVLLGQRDLRRRIEAASAQPDHVERHGDLARATPRVSVVLTVYNYAHTVAEAIGSVAASDLAEKELVIVDDASTDRSRDVVKAALASYPELAATLILRGSNQGLPSARNLGIEHARGDCVFILDADNAIYPHCLSRLVAALDADPDAAFAYGILEVFESSRHVGLESWRDWDPARLRYGNYVDAMAMIRRDVLTAAGGYTTDPRLFGWEDFALWCTLAERGWRGIRVPEIVARYRKALLSMLSLTDIDGRAAWAALLESHPRLAASG
jgi:hypothetical protein